MFRGRSHFLVTFLAAPGDTTGVKECSHCLALGPLASSILVGTVRTRRMRLLVLSDLHANLTALEAAKGSWERVVCLGDVVGYGPDPDEVSTRIRELGAATIRGNHDKAVADLMSTEDFNPVAKMAVNWTRAQLSNENMDWLAALPQGPLEAE